MISEKLSSKDIKIFTNFRGDNDQNWLPFLDLYPPPIRFEWIKKIPLFGGYLFSTVHAIEMYKHRKNYDLAILAGTRAGNIYSIIQTLLPFKKIPVFYFSNLWDVNNNKLLYFFKWIQIYLMNKSALGFALNSSADAEPYSKFYPVPFNKFLCLPYFTTLWKYDFVVKDEGYIFSGGNGQRDYRQLIEAARELPYEFVIASTDKSLFAGVDLPANVTVEGVSHERFRELMASATIHVVAMAGGYLRSGGHQTYLNAMAMNKPVIVTDKRGTSDYIEDGVDGFLLEPGDVEGLRQVITRLMGDSELRAKIAINAKRKADQFSGSIYLKKLREVAVEKFNDIRNRKCMNS